MRRRAASIFGRIILGTYLPSDGDTFRKISKAYATQEFIDAHKMGWLVEDLKYDAADGAFCEWLLYQPWHSTQAQEPNGGNSWVGLEIDSFDCIDPTVLSSLSLRATDEQYTKSRLIYKELSEEVRVLLPKFDAYVIWSI